jgi:hypothetical protein
MSDSRSRLPTLPCSRAWSAGANLRTINRAASASGTLIRNSASQPTRLTSRPPTTGPTAAPDVLAIWMRPSGRVDVEFACLARTPTMTTALGYAVAVPSALPSMKSRRGPNLSASRPISGWPAAEVM